MSPTTVKSHEPRLRADALRNRERIISAAREMFVEQGADVPMDEVARRAGIGNATLYRHFPDRHELIHRVSLHVMERIIDRAEAALTEESDAFEALRRFVHAAADERIGALCPLISQAGDAKDHPDTVEAGERLDGAINTLMERARSSGQLRQDVAVGDVVVAVTQLTRPLPGDGCSVGFDGFVHRHLQLLLDGLRAPARSELPGSAVTLEDLRQRS
ncbi:TetR/AcrR family transcriptional regulator [Streptomyces sp. NPDC048639]|uniref:TetR/AcrR family transcriptional regulator n=1 Tax=Streptomyces sp. NPDC048639 TaxID=3365581 RepID=UPI0037104F5B